MKILQINTTVNSGSTGRIAEDIGLIASENGHESYIAYGRGDRPSKSKLIKVGTKLDTYFHGIKTIAFDRHGFGSKDATIQLIKKIESIKPDVIGLHNLHGYYLNIELLFNHLSKSNVPVLWTLFDCWAFTGHCTYFDDINCIKWLTQCSKCPKRKKYPASYFLDQSTRNFEDKKGLFNSLSNLHVVVHSQWLKDLVSQSFLKECKLHLIASGIDLDIFKPYPSLHLREKHKLTNRKVLLGVANIWDGRKGLLDFIELSRLIDNSYTIVLIGLTSKQQKALPENIIAIERTENTRQLAEWYSLADIFVNPTYQDNFPTTNLEALACGTPVITYDTGGSPEAIDEFTGSIVPKGNLEELHAGIEAILLNGKTQYSEFCISRAEKLFNKNIQYGKYIDLYDSLHTRHLTGR